MANVTGPVAGFDEKRGRRVGRQLRVMREDAGLTQRELADRLGITQAVISKYENGVPPTRVLMAAADVCGWRLSAFFAALEPTRIGEPAAAVDEAIAHDALVRRVTRLEEASVTMTISKTRSVLYRISRLLGDVQAVKRGKVARRVGRRVAGRATGRLLGRLFK